VTIYRDGSRDTQVLNIGLGTKKTEGKPQAKKQTEAPSGNGHGTDGYGHTATPAAAVSTAVRLTAGGAQIAVKAPVVSTSDATKQMVRRFRLVAEEQRLMRLAQESKLYLTDEKGVRLPLQLVAQEGVPTKGLQFVVEAVSAEPPVEVSAGQAAPKCPECGAALVMGEGCQTCQACGYSKCG
jgi:ribonucleoside-diphosphate reductase alpha chain